MTMVAHLTTVHARDDVRILLKELRSLADSSYDAPVLIVADGRGNATAAGGVCIHDVGSLPPGRALRFIHGTFAVFRAVRRRRPAVVHFHDPELIPLGFLLKAYGCRVIYDVHEDLPRQILSKHWVVAPLRKAVAAAAGAVEWLAGRWFDGVVAATPTIAERFPPRKRVLVPNYPLLSEFVTSGTRAHAERPRSFAYIGGIADIRGARQMVAAADLLRSEGVRLHLAGRFDRPETHEELARMPGWSEAVTLHGHVDRASVVALLSAVRAGLVVLQPLRSYMDAWPIKLFEYMAVGLPVIASDFPVWRDIIDRERCGLLVDPTDAGAIASAMKWVIEHPGEAEEMGRRGRSAIEQRYNWQAAAEPLLDLYARIMKG